jgi:protein ImuA
MAARIERQQGNMREGAPPETRREGRIEALRRHIADKERATPRQWPHTPLGPQSLDAVLPGDGLASGALHEALPASHADFGATLGFALGAAARLLTTRPGYLLWALPAHHAFAEGTLYPLALMDFGIAPDRVLHVSVPDAKALFWALEQALEEQAVSTVLGILPGNDSLYDFTASRRLSMRAARHGTTALIVAGRPGFATATAAETRWTIAARQSLARHRPGQGVAGLGAPRWQAHLTKSRKGLTGHWPVEWDHETLSFRLAAPLADRTALGTSGKASGQSAAA